ncbi:glycoside hydrolase family 25 protein [Streptomyces sp. NPDC002248]
MIKGVDVSSYQPEQFSTSGYSFVFVKATEGTSYINPKMKAQAAWARKKGLLLGFYHFLHPGNVQAQAEYFVSKCDSVGVDILACDWESGTQGIPSNADKDAFLKAVKKLRPTHKVILYTGQNLWLTKDKTSFVQDGLWIAQYNDRPGQPNIKASWLFHQYTSTPIDTNVANFKDKAAMAAWMGAAAEEEDPMAGYTKNDIRDAAWNTDGAVPAPSYSSTKKENPSWKASSLLVDMAQRIYDLQAQLKKLQGTNEKLVDAIGNLGKLNVDELRKQIQDMVNGIDISLEVKDK